MDVTPKFDGSIDYRLPSEAPEWFVQNLKNPGLSQTVPYLDGHVHLLTWNWQREDLPVLLLVHGFCAHAYWWSFLAPEFTERFRVAAIDLPGMGDSSHVAQYHDNVFAEGLLAVVKHFQLNDVTLVGHSFGGAQTARALALTPDYFKRGVIIDTVVFFAKNYDQRLIEPKMAHRLRRDQQQCIRHFRLMPEQPSVLDYVNYHIAFHACKGDENGWYWKFDPKIQNYGDLTSPGLLGDIPVPVDCVYGQCSIFNKEALPERIFGALANPGQLVIVPDAHHHLMVDHPVELTQTLQRLLS